MLKEHDSVGLIEEVKDDGEIFSVGTLGTVVSIYNNGEAFAVEVIEGRKLPSVIIVPASKLKAIKS